MAAAPKRHAAITSAVTTAIPITVNQTTFDSSLRRRRRCRVRGRGAGVCAARSSTSSPLP
jgi:hypothetical protein